ncbi:hypothetical protein HF394_03620 [Planococcus glaciei]|uniref:Glycerophosphoryl diester phosphodiesterase membrane domain-containing protein n=1 Tax=Planococcus glaciei TaxID=459472 RepID=A0A7H8Q705_9BACL|nr:hypothetical protein [Planococcus glaciei]QKX49744.1 hypothetical protein HF394_03620 [Planococcus glaciei]
MERPIRSALTFFGQKYELILLLVLFIQLPIILLQFFASNYILAATPTFGALFSIADVYNAYMVFVLFLFALVPFAYFWHFEAIGKEKPLRLTFFQFALKGFHFFLFAAAAGALITIGFGLFVLPGIVLLAIFSMAPIIAVMENQSVWSSLKESTRIFKAQHWKIVLLIAVFGFAEMIGAYVLQLMVMGITTSFLAIVVCHVFLNTIFLPLFYLILASFTAKWKEELSLLTIENDSFLVSK